jgi:hypothetical protein
VTEPHDQPRADRIRRRQALVAVGVRLVVFVVQVACLLGTICGMTLNIRDQRRDREDADG